jgi:SAM-dependent methyltransferase
MSANQPASHPWDTNRDDDVSPATGAFVEVHGSGFRVNRRKRLGSILQNEILLQEVENFLRINFGGEPRGSLLDLGAGVKPYAPVYRPHFEECIAVDVPHSPHDISGVDVFASAEELPFGEDSFDCVICTEVIEHCTDPATVMKEIRRVLKPGGTALVTTPFLVPLHDMPYDFWRFTPSALRLLAERAGLEVDSIRPRGEYSAVLIEMLVRMQLRAWRLLSRVARTDLARPANPIVFLAVVVPQLLYLRAWRRIRRREKGWAFRVYEKASYVSLGYVTTLRKS